MVEWCFTSTETVGLLGTGIVRWIMAETPANPACTESVTGSKFEVSWDLTVSCTLSGSMTLL